MTFFCHYVYVLRTYALAPLPLSHGALYFLIIRTRTHLWKKYRWRSTALEKLEVAERRSGALRPTWTTGSWHSTWFASVCVSGCVSVRFNALTFESLDLYRVHFRCSDTSSASSGHGRIYRVKVKVTGAKKASLHAYPVRGTCRGNLVFAVNEEI